MEWWKASGNFALILRRLLCGGLPLLIFSACVRRERPQPMANDAYVWQRRWDEGLLAALRESASFIRTWRVLAAEADAKADLTKIKVDREALRRIGKPVIAVIRIDGRSGTTPLGVKLAMEIAALAADWKKDGVPVSGIEIDYDCATSRLPRYREFLTLLRAQILKSMTLSITALPSWIGNGDLRGVLAEVDEAVLQVHSVMSPQKGLFDRATAYKWTQAWSTVSPVPFRLALPTYWSRVSWNEDGRVSAIESEAARYGSDVGSRELVVAPADVSALVAQLMRTRPSNLRGIAWFRLPTSEDARAWSSHTWHSVMQGQVMQAPAPVVRFKADQTGARDVYLLNPSDVEMKLPAKVEVVAQGCEFADAMPPYDMEKTTGEVQFELKGDDLLRAGQERMIGWIRCSGELKTHVSY